MAWFNFGGEDLGAELRENNARLARIERNQEKLMSTNDDLTASIADLREALTELSPLPAKIAELTEQIANGNVDNALVAEVRGLADQLSNIVPDPEVETPVDPEPPVEEPTA